MGISFYLSGWGIFLPKCPDSCPTFLGCADDEPAKRTMTLVDVVRSVESSHVAKCRYVDDWICILGSIILAFLTNLTVLLCDTAKQRLSLTRAHLSVSFP